MKSPLQYPKPACQPPKNPRSIRIRRFSLSLHRTPLAPPQTEEFVSPVPHLLTSNAAPSDSERILIQDAIESVSNQLSAPASKAIHAPTIDPVVQRHFETEAEFIQAHKAVLSPMRMLPPEIIAEIICIYSESFLLASQQHNIALASGSVIYPYIPSQVSRLWRSTALSLHHLWGQLVVDACLWESSKPSKSFLGRFATLVDRSQNALLRVYFCTHSDVDLDDLRPIIEVLASHSERWEAAYLIGTHSMLSCFQSIQGRLPSLKRLLLSFSGEFAYTTDLPVDMFEVAPQLKELYLLTSYFSSEVLMPWSQLEIFFDRGDWTNHRPSIHPMVLSQSLINLQLSRFPIEDLQKQWPDRTLSHLRTLNLNLCNNDDDGDDTHDTLSDNLLQSLTIPNINEIKITNYPGNIIPPLISLIDRSQMCTSLQELCLSTYHLGESEPGEVTTLLQLTPLLRKLSIYLPSIHDLSQLVIRPGTPIVLPRLEELYIFIYDTPLGYEEVFCQLTNSRCEPILHDSSFPDPHTSSMLFNLKPTQLYHLRLIFPGSVSCHTGQELLETHNFKCKAEAENERDSTKHLSEAALARVVNLKNWTVLANCLPSVFAYFWSTNSKLGAKIKRALQVSQFFSLIESMKVNDVRELHMSEIHHLINHIQNMSSADIPGDNIYHFRKRAKTLLDKWGPLLLNDIKNRRWAFQGAHSIVYVPTDSAIRTSPDVLTYMIYGPSFYPQKYSVSWYDLQVLLQFLD